MPSQVHETAVISSDAQIGENVTIGAYSVIEGPVVIGPHVAIGHHCLVQGATTLGEGCQLFTGAVIGSPPQDKKYQKTDKVYLKIGKDNIFREYVTVNPGTVEGGGVTCIGNNNLFMACSHVAHDCTIGDDCVLANYVGLSGHVTIQDKAVIGGLSGVHQFARVGFLSMVGGCSKVNQDVPPYALVDGNPATLRGLNVIGLKRSDLSFQVMLALRRAFKILFNSGLARSNAVAQVKQQLGSHPEILRILEFIENSKRGIS
ncbi:MAG: acyl-ACP--UDP-N-acetylglucosamine O-acyltransferase [Candidatus Omnitrophica bacterium]|nr:acyl-ACP--UDP-N-acetylglucosamine O-acyltransferase [Candidatus Omnitrophota bacterium]